MALQTVQDLVNSMRGMGDAEARYADLIRRAEIQEQARMSQIINQRNTINRLLAQWEARPGDRAVIREEIEGLHNDLARAADIINQVRMFATRLTQQSDPDDDMAGLMQSFGESVLKIMNQ